MTRNHAEETPAVTGGTNFDVQRTASFAMEKFDQGGRMAPTFKDQNGRQHEVRNSKDLDYWQKNNQLGKPRMVEWRNHITGEVSWVPQRTVMQRDLKTGEVMDLGSVIREAADLVPLDKNRGEFVIPKINHKTKTRLNDKGVAENLQKPNPNLKHGKYCNCPTCCMTDGVREQHTGGTGGIDPSNFMPQGYRK